MNQIDFKKRSLLTQSLSVVGATALGGLGISSCASIGKWTAKQFHNQPAQSHQHSFLVNMWNQVDIETNGRLSVTVYPQNKQIAGSDPGALDMLQKGDLEFFTLMGGILGKVVPVAEIQGLPFAFSTHEQVHRVNEGALGEYLGKECAAKGIYRFQYGLMENGFRQIGMIDRPIRTVDDLIGMKIRVPDGDMFRDLFSSFGSQPVTVNIRELYESLKTKKVDGQENPLVITEVNKLYEVSHYQSITNHMWSGFNLLSNLKFWNGLPEDIQQIVQSNVKKYVAQQRIYTNNLNKQLEVSLKDRGQKFNVANTASFRKKLGDDFYRVWKTRLGNTGWALLENDVGKLG
jgi:TRAP-type transport system periplasmic protein